MKTNHPKLTVVIDGDSILEFNRNQPLPARQREYLDRMDEKMRTGIKLGDDEISEPNTLQCAQFVASSLIYALQEDNDPIATAMCSYLAKRIPDLKQVKAKTEDDSTSIELVFDRGYEEAQQEQVISFNL
ncbi:MAG: hypothetical protein KAH22_01500 [Thiotrichaceae bacterium]|nr:hypothetical protein [Thiotrichaceae bacterium]